MPLQAFSFPFPETRFFKAGDLIYKFKIRGSSSYRNKSEAFIHLRLLDGDVMALEASHSEKEIRGEDCFTQEMEEIIRTVLGNLDRLEPFSTNHYIVFPYRNRRERLHDHFETKLRHYPFTIVLYLEKNLHNGKHTGTAKEKEVMQHSHSVSHERPPKRRRSDSPLEEAILKDLIKDMEVDVKKSVSRKLDLGHHHAENVSEDPALHDKPETTEDTEQEKGTHAKPGILKQLVSNIFPFFFKATDT